MASLADLYQRGGQIQAQNVLSQAEIEAQRRQQSANNWGRAFATIGDIAANLPQQLQQNKLMQEQQAARQAQAAKIKQGEIDQQAVNQIIAGFATDANGARKIPRDKLMAQFAQANIPLELQSQTLKALDAVDGSLDAFAESRRKHGAEFAKAVLNSNVDLNDPQALTLSVALAKANGLIDDDFIGQFGQALQAGIPAKTLLEQLSGPQEKKAPMVVGPNSGVFDPNTNTWLAEPTTPEAKLYPVTVDDGKGRPIEKLFTAEQLQQGVPAYRAPRDNSSEPLVAIMGDDGNPVLVPRGQAIGKRPANTREQGRPVVSGDANRIADLDTSLNDLDTLTKTIPKGSTGPGAQAGAAMPNWVTAWTGMGATAKSKQAVIDRVKQVIGKALEGGVLRKEDEYKYEKILPTIGDVDSVVATKLAGLKTAIEQRRQTLLDSLGDAGYDVSRYNARQPQAPQNIGRFKVEVE